MPRYRLHYFPESGNSYKIALMLTLCGQPWEPVWTDFLGGQTRSPEWRATVNEMGEIPVLEDEGTRLTQTGAILLRLGDRHSPLPRSGRKVCGRWSTFCSRTASRCCVVGARLHLHLARCLPTHSRKETPQISPDLYPGRALPPLGS